MYTVSAEKNLWQEVYMYLVSAENNPTIITI